MSLPSFLFETVYRFSPAVNAGLASGRLRQVVTAAGQVLPLVQDSATGAFVEIAKASTQLALAPVMAITNIGATVVETGVLSIQMNQGFQRTYREIGIVQESLKSLQQSMTTLQANVGVLQASTAILGLGVATNLALSAVSLHQILKIRKDINLARIEIQDGFTDLKKILGEQNTEIINYIDKVAEDLKFHSQQLLMVKAYGQFREAIKLVGIALSANDVSFQNDALNTALGLLTNALTIYNSTELFIDTSSIAYLRRAECAWAIEQMIALVFQLRHQDSAVKDWLICLQQKIQEDTLAAIDRCESEQELEFLFPEVTRIQRLDVPILQTWYAQIEWVQELTPKEIRRFNTIKMAVVEEADSRDLNNDSLELPEQGLYKRLRKTSHFLALKDQLRFIVKPELRKPYEHYINKQSKVVGYKALAAAGWDDISDHSIANLYWHLKYSEHVV